MVKAMEMKAMKQKSGYQLDEFDVGQVKAHMHHGLGSTTISGIMLKADGKGSQLFLATVCQLFWQLFASF